MVPTTPTPLTWTLRLKHHRTTVLLHIDPLETLTSLKTELLRALHETQPSGQLNNQPLPDSPDSIHLARPVDFNDLRKGWVTLRGASGSNGNNAESDVKKGKRKAGAGGTGDEVSVKSVGLRDNAVVAFKWGGARKRKFVEEEREDEDANDELEADREEQENEEWDVEVPTYEDTYGIEPEAEGEEFEGEVGDAVEAEED